MNLETPVPDVGTPMFDTRTGVINPVWQLFFNNLLRRTGNEQGISSDDQQAQIDSNQARLLGLEGQDQASVGIIVPRFEEDAARVAHHGQHDDPGLHEVATAQSNGFMAAGDKGKLDSVVLPSTSPSALVADVVTQNTTVDGPVLSFLLPAGVAAVGTTIAFKLWARISSAASSGTLSFWVMVGAAKFVTLSFTLPASAQSNVGAVFSGTLTIRALGVVGSLQTAVKLESALNALSAGPLITTQIGAFDTTVANTLTVGWNWSAANAANVATAKNASIYMEKQQ